MSVASITKTKLYTTVLLGTLAAISASSTWAMTIPETSFVDTVEQNVVSTQWTQELSVLRTKLKERFSGVAQEVQSLVRGQKSISGYSHEIAPRSIDVHQGIGITPAIFGQDFFVDIENDPYRSYINRLASYDVLAPSQKFFPQNYFRVDDFLWLLQKLYTKRFNQVLPSDILTLSTDDGIMTKRQIQQILSSLKGIVSLEIDWDSYDKLIRSEWAYYLVRMFDVPALELPNPSLWDLPNYFSDTVWHPFVYAIHTLANLGITNMQAEMFYPDNYLRHYDFIILFVNSLMYVNGQSLGDGVYSSFADVGSSASYLPQLIYAADRGLIDQLMVSKRGQLYFEPDAFMTKHEVYQILGKTLGLQFDYDEEQAATEKITRGELAQLLVQSLDLQPKIVPSEPDTPDDVTLLNKLRVLLSLL